MVSLWFNSIPRRQLFLRRPPFAHLLRHPQHQPGDGHIDHRRDAKDPTHANPGGDAGGDHGRDGATGRGDAIIQRIGRALGIGWRPEVHEGGHWREETAHGEAGQALQDDQLPGGGDKGLG